jgi:MFS family permease
VGSGNQRGCTRVPGVTNWWSSPVGLLVYSAGSLITALSPNATVLIMGWSFVEALGAILVIPAIAALTAANYSGHDRERSRSPVMRSHRSVSRRSHFSF